MRWFFVLFKILFFVPLRLLFPYKVIGKQRLPRGKYYVSVSNHLSTRDCISLGLYLPGFRYFLAKKELNKNKVIGFFLKMMGAVYIDRNGLDFKAIKNCIKGLKNAPLSIFPEGTRGKDEGSLQEVKGGAAMIAVKADVDVVPVMIHHKSKLFNRNYLLVGEKIELPYTSKDRFNGDALAVCTEIITEKMTENKKFLDMIVAEKTWKQHRREIKQTCKQAKKNKTETENVA